MRECARTHETGGCEAKIYAHISLRCFEGIRERAKETEREKEREREGENKVWHPGIGGLLDTATLTTCGKALQHTATSLRMAGIVCMSCQAMG